MYYQCAINHNHTVVFSCCLQLVPSTLLAKQNPQCVLACNLGINPCMLKQFFGVLQLYYQCARKHHTVVSSCCLQLVPFTVLTEQSSLCACLQPANQPLHADSICWVATASFPEGEDTASESVVEVRMTVDESGDVSMLSGEVQKWFRLHAELPVETLMDPALLVANTHILFNPKRGDIKVC